MKSSQITFGGNDFVGIFVKTSEKLTLVPTSISDKNFNYIKEALGTEVVKCTLSNSELIGLFSVINKNGALLSPLVFKEEIDLLKNHFDVVDVLDSEFVATGNIITANDKIALISPLLSQYDEKKIQDVLNVETIRLKVGEYLTPGANIVLTNKGALINPSVAEPEVEKLREIGIESVAGTLNNGIKFVGLCAVANQNGYVAGLSTKGLELNRIETALFY